MTTQRRRAPTTRRISDQWLQYVRSSVTESAANTFTEAQINLPVVVAEGFVIEAHLVEFQIPGPDLAALQATDDNASVSVQLTKATQSAIVPLSDPDYIYGHQLQWLSPAARTAEKAPVLPIQLFGALNWQFPEPILLPFEQIHLGAVSFGLASAQTYRVRIGYKTVRLTTRQLPELIQAVT